MPPQERFRQDAEPAADLQDRSGGGVAHERRLGVGDERIGKERLAEPSVRADAEGVEGRDHLLGAGRYSARPGTIPSDRFVLPHGRLRSNRQVR